MTNTVPTMGGVMAAVLTPISADGTPDVTLAARHCRWLLENGCDGLAVLGTTGEANSFSVDERIGLLEGLIARGIPPQTLMPGTGCCAVSDTVALSRRAVDLGCGGVLMLPPFYYKNVTDDGLFAGYAEVIERVGHADFRVYLYHFPQMSAVPLGGDLIERLREAFPNVIAGMKDSSGDFANMRANVDRFPGFAVLSGSDEFLLPLLEAGGAGCITAVANVAAAVAAQVLAHWRAGDGAAAEEAQMRLTAARKVIAAHPLSAALKEIMALHSGYPDWRNLRPPLVPLPAAEAERLMVDLAGIGFTPPRIR